MIDRIECQPNGIFFFIVMFIHVFSYLRKEEWKITPTLQSYPNAGVYLYIILLLFIFRTMLSGTNSYAHSATIDIGDFITVLSKKTKKTWSTVYHYFF